MKYCLLFIAVIFSCTYSPLHAQQLYVLSANNRIVEMANVRTPANIGTLRAVSGLTTGQNLLAIDMQPGTGELFALAYSAEVSEAQLYTIDVTSLPYAAVPVNDPFPLTLDTKAVAGFDINPLNTAEIYLTAADGGIYILNAVTGDIAFTSGSIFYAKNDIHAAVTPSITGIAFTSNYWGADDADVIGYDVSTNTLVQFDSYTGATIHSLGQSGISLQSTTPVGFDSRFDTTGTNVFYMAARPAGAAGYSLFRLDPNTGTAEVLGLIGNGSIQVNDIAVNMGATPPPPVQGQIITALTRSRRQLIFFDSYNPGIIRDVKAITGIAPGQTVMAIDYRPLDLDLYAFAYDPLPQEYQLYRIDIITGAAIPVSAEPQVMDLGVSDDIWASFDFNPLNDRVQLVSSNGTSFQINPVTGTVLAEDDEFVYASADPHSGALTRVGTIAYTSSYFNSTASQRLGIDLANRTLVHFTGNNFTTLNTMAELNNLLDTGSQANAYIDLYYAPDLRADIGFLAVNTKAYNSSSLYRLDTRNGNTTLAGLIGPGIPVADIAVQPSYTGTTVTAGDVPLGAGGIYLYPNPVNSQANIILPAVATQRVSVSILDFNGNILISQVYKPGGNQVSLDVSALPNGMYSLRVQEYGSPLESIRLVKQ